MAITRKPKPAQTSSESAVMAAINKGGSVAATSTQTEPELASVLIRLPSDMLARIDASVRRRLPVRISRVAWIIEALQERLKAEKHDT